MASAKKSAKTRASAHPKDAIAMLKADHKKVSGLFEQFGKTTVKAALRDKELVPEANVEHATVKDLIAQVRGAEPGGEEYDARVKVMSEYVKHHVKEEHTEMFPKARKTKLDMVALGGQMAARKAELLVAGAV